MQGVALDQFLELGFKKSQPVDERFAGNDSKNGTSWNFSVNNAMVARIAIRTLPSEYKSLIRVLTRGNHYPAVEEIIA